MGGGRRPVRLRAAVPLADDRRQGASAATKGKKKMTIAQLVQAMEEPATQDLRGYRLLPTIFKAIGKPKSAQLRRALATLRTWHEARRPPPRPRPRRRRRGNAGDRADGRLVAEAGRRRVQAGARRQGLRTARGDAADRRLHRRLADAHRTSSTAGGATSPRTCATSSARSRKGAWSRIYCGGGSKKKCRAMLQRTLRAALKVTPAAALRRRQRRLRRQPAALLLRPEPADGDRRHRTRPLPVPEPADLPAGRDADPEAAALSGGRRNRHLRPSRKCVVPRGRMSSPRLDQETSRRSTFSPSAMLAPEDEPLRGASCPRRRGRQGSRRTTGHCRSY